MSPDVGGVVRARALAKRLDDADLAIIDKRRPRPSEARVMNIIGDVKERTCVIIDDLVATGGTLGSAMSLVKMMEGVVVECACVVELKMFIDPPADSGLPSRNKLYKDLGHDDVPIWGLISEDILTNQASLPEGYVDDGEEH